jgi:hypothetical protein
VEEFTPMDHETDYIDDDDQVKIGAVMGRRDGGMGVRRKQPGCGCKYAPIVVRNPGQAAMALITAALAGTVPLRAAWAIDDGSAESSSSTTQERGGLGFSDTGISGKTAWANRRQRSSFHEEAETEPRSGVQGAGGLGGDPG